jgi:hypothetical protein
LLLPTILVFLIPIAAYCWVLAAVNRRPQPTMVSGTLDCAGMLLAASGILLMVGPILLNKIFLRIMEAIPLEEDTTPAFAEVESYWWFSWVLYFTLLPVVVCLLLWWRRTKTVIYNVDPDAFLHVLHESLERLGLTSTPGVGNRRVIAPKAHANVSVAPPGTRAGEPLTGEPLNGPLTDHLAPHASAELAVETFPSMCHVSLHWLRADRGLRAAVENDLARGLAGARTFENAAANWLLGFTGLLFGLIFLTGMILILTLYLPPRR